MLHGTAVDETRKAIDCEDHGHRSKQTMTVIVAVYLPDSPLHIVSILCHVCQQLIVTVVWQEGRTTAALLYSLNEQQVHLDCLFNRSSRC